MPTDETVTPNLLAAEAAAPVVKKRRRRRGRSLADDLRDWSELLVALADHAQDLAFLDPQRAGLEALLAQCHSLAETKTVHLAAAQVATQELRTRVDAARKLAGRVRSGVKAHFGFGDPQLVQFGSRPLRRTPRPRARPETPAAP